MNLECKEIFRRSSADEIIKGELVLYKSGVITWHSHYHSKIIFSLKNHGFNNLGLI